MNTYDILGRLGMDAEIKTLAQNKVLSFTMAIDRSYWDKNAKQRVERTEWIRVNKFFDLQNEVKLAQYLTKGTLVYVSGIPKAEAWTNKQGEIQSAVSVTGRDIQILASASVKSTTANETPY